MQLKKRRGHKRAIIAIARMLLTAIYHILKNKENPITLICIKNPMFVQYTVKSR
ncbi:hypothetical protein EDD64_13264 [Effusibacillus lacus]|nr:hypothetical protein EDD64_13264 [Effusibacillus lacus]